MLRDGLAEVVEDGAVRVLFGIEALSLGTLEQTIDLSVKKLSDSANVTARGFG